MGSVPDSRELAAVLERSADPALATAALERLVSAHPDLGDELAHDHFLAEVLVPLVVASRSILGAIVADPGIVDLLRDREDLAREHSLAAYRDHADAALAAADDPLRALRRWKRRELARIAARDVRGLANLPTTARELAALAQAALEMAVRLAEPGVPFTVIGMGKLGGRELNYASDVDVVFVHDGPLDEAERAARRVLRAMATPTADGIVFRTDADLRPEGRAGVLSRSLEGFVQYWERWAQAWEFQALLKARPVAGDRALGDRFVDAAQRFVWPEVLDPNAIREIRAMKARAEDQVRRTGMEARELKRGWGGIRDIEFSVQLLQLVHGRHDPSIRSANTLEAIGALAAAEYVNHAEAARLDAAYRWLRTVEHRVQLVDEQQTHVLPADDDARTLLARVLGFRDRGEERALEQFERTHRTHQRVARSLHEQLFFEPLLETLAGTGPMRLDAAEERLAAFGFVDLERTRTALRELSHGLSRRSRLMQELLPALLAWLSSTPDPDLGLLQLRRLVDGEARATTVLRAFREAPIAAEQTCRLLGSSRLVGDMLRRQPEFVDALADGDTLATASDREALTREALDTLDWRGDEDERRAGLRRFKRRQLLRLAARDLLGFASIHVVERELAALAEACIESALQSLDPRVPFAVIGMGRLGGGELSYASDVDVLFVYDGDRPSDFDAAERLATRLMRSIGSTTAEGNVFEIDAKLRPEGKQGPLARSLGAYRQYYERWAQTWELQALLRARPVAGDKALGEAFLELIEPFVYRDPFPPEEVREVQRIKTRVEKERIPSGEDPRFHLKLGRGSLSDVEFTVQLLQLQHGARDPSVRSPSTIDALAALAEAGQLAPDDAAVLADAYVLCERARNARFLVNGTGGDALPPDGPELEHLARLMGYVAEPQHRLRDDYRRTTRRARQVVERVFYGRRDDE